MKLQVTFNIPVGIPFNCALLENWHLGNDQLVASFCLQVDMYTTYKTCHLAKRSGNVILKLLIMGPPA